MFARSGMYPEGDSNLPLLTLQDWKFFPRALAETMGLSVFGHNVYAIKAH